MKTASTHCGALLRHCVCLISLLMCLKSSAQTTIINYNFDVSKIQDYPKFYTRAVNGISCLLSSTTGYSQGLHDGSTGGLSGTATGASAFTANTVTSPNRIVALSGAISSYFNFQISGSSIKAYNTFKIYFQAEKNASGTSTINSVQYSIDGGAFSNLATTLAMTTSWAEFKYNLPVVSPTSTIDIRINFTNSASGTIFAVDNFQVQATGPSTASAAIASVHPLAGNIFQNTTSNLLSAFRIDAHVSTITPSSISFKTAGTYSSTDITNFKLWQNSYCSFYGATQVGSTVATAASGSTLTFNTGFSSILANSSAYFFITADVASAATSGNTINITTTAFSNFSFSGSVTKIGNDPVTVGNTQTIVASTSYNRYTSTSAFGNWDNGTLINRWATSSGGSYTNKWVQNAIATLEGTGGNVTIDGSTGATAQQINATVNSYSLLSSSSTTDLILTNPAKINVSNSYVLKLSSSTSTYAPILTTNGFIKEGTGEVMFQTPFHIHGTGTQGPIYINGGTLTIGNKNSTSANPNLYVYDNDFFINNGKLTIAAPDDIGASLGLLRSMRVDGSGSNVSEIEIYKISSGTGSLYAEITYDDRYPQLSNDLVPLYIKGRLALKYGGNTGGITTRLVFGNTTLTGNSIFKTSTNGSGNLVSSSGIITNLELVGEGGRSGLSSGLVGTYTLTDNGYTLGVEGGGSSTSDGGYVSINGSGTNTGAWTVGNADGSEAGYLAINDVTGLTSGSITVNQNSQLDINVSGASVTIAKTPTITLNGAKTFSYYGAMALLNSTANSSSTLSSPIVVNTSDATVGVYNDAWTLGGAISGSGGLQMYGSASTYDLTLTSSSNTWTGGTKVLSGILNVSSGSSISTGSLTMGQFSGFNTALNLNNSAQTVSSLTSSWTNISGTQSQTITLASGHVLTINQSSTTTYGDGAVSTLTAIIAGAGNLIKDGSGTLTLTGANTYTGLTQVKGGILKLNRTNSGSCLPSTNNVHIIGGTLQVSQNQTLNNVILSTGTLQVDNGVTLTINGTFTLVNGTINLVGTGKIAYGSSGLLAYAGSSAQTSSVLEIPASNGPKGIIVDNNTSNGVTLSANVSNLTGASTVNGWLDFNGKTLTGTAGTFTLNGLIGPYSFTGTTSTSSNVITSVSSTTGLNLGMKLIGSSLPSGTYIIYINPLVANTVTMNNNGSSNASGTTITAAWRGGLKVSLPEGIGNGTVNSHVQVTGSKTYNSGANYVFNTPTSGTSIYPAFPTVGTLTYSPAYNVTVQAGASNKVILGTSQDIEISNDLTLTSGKFVSNNNLITWDNSGGTLTSPNVPYTTLNTLSNNSYIALCTNTGANLTPTSPYDGSKGFKIKNVGSSTDIYFPIGSDLVSSNRMMINNTGTTTDITVLMTYGDLAQTPGARVNRIWYLKSSAASGVKATMKLFFTKQDWTTWPSPENEVESGFLYSDIHLIQKNYAGSFINKSTGADVSGANFTSATYANTEIYGQYNIGVSPDYSGAKNGINNFTRFSLVNENIILPVSVINLKAYQKADAVSIDFTALNEINIDHYEVERSTNVLDFKTLGNISARNNGLAQNTYSLTDVQPATGNNFYRIKTTDKNGAITYTAIVTVNLSSGKISVTVQPNPVHDKQLNLQLNNLAAGKYNMVLYNSIGQQVYNKTIEHGGGSSSQSLHLPANTSTGTYVLKLFNETAGFTIRLVVE